MVNDSHLFTRDSFPNQSSKCRGLLAIEIGFKPVANCLVQQNSRPSRTEYNFHLSGRGFSRVELNNRLSCSLVSEVFGRSLCLEILDAHAPAAAGIAPSGILPVFGDTERAHARQRLRVGCNYAI